MKESTVKELKDEIAHLRVQLAGCGVAAMGYCRPGTKDDCKKGDYGYSASLGDAQALYEKYLALYREINDPLALFAKGYYKKGKK